MSKQYKPREADKILKKSGFEEVRSRGSHRIYSNGKATISIPVIKLNCKLFKRLIKENNLVV